MSYPRIDFIGICFAALFWTLVSCSNASVSTTADHQDEVRKVPGLIAFWDFESESEGTLISEGTAFDFPIQLSRIGDSSNYSVGSWPYLDHDSRIEFDRSGPFGRAIRFNRGYIYGSIARKEFRGTELDIKGKMPFTLVAWVKFVGERHMVAGIWDEGGWSKYAGRRQIALFAGLFQQKGVIGHVSSTGAASYPQADTAGSQYARVRAIDGAPFEDHQWVCMAMSYDPVAEEVRAYLDGNLTEYELTDPVEFQVYGSQARSKANPLKFRGPIYGEDILVTKFSPSSDKHSQIIEHRIEMNLANRTVVYQCDRRDGNSSKSGPRYRVKVLLDDPEGNALVSPLYIYEDNVAIMLQGPLRRALIGTFHASLERQVGKQWIPDGPVVTRAIELGAPFTFGRALGLASEEIEHGSQLFVDGVAVFNRALSEEELEKISFPQKHQINQ